LHRNGLISAGSFLSKDGRCLKWGWLDPGKELCWWVGGGGVFQQRVLKNKREVWW